MLVLAPPSFFFIREELLGLARVFQMFLGASDAHRKILVPAGIRIGLTALPALLFQCLRQPNLIQKLWRSRQSLSVIPVGVLTVQAEVSPQIG